MLPCFLLSSCGNGSYDCVHTISLEVFVTWSLLVVACGRWRARLYRENCGRQS